jgi:hypothetical protein
LGFLQGRTDKCSIPGATKAAKFARQRNYFSWETLAQRRKIARIYALYKAYTRERAWKAISDRLQKPCSLSRADQGKNIRSRKQKTDVGKYFLVKRTIQLWNQLPADALETLSYKPCNFKVED